MVEIFTVYLHYFCRGIIYAKKKIYVILSPFTHKSFLFKLICSFLLNNGENLPRIHDLRFTFIVHSFRKYCSTGKDPMAFLPILQNYVGHKSIKSLEYYLKTTNIDLENALKISEREFGSLIPTIGNKYE